MNPKVDEFIRKSGTWRKEYEALRAILLASPLTEELKWGKPCYTFQDSNIVIVQGFKQFCALLFPKSALLKDARNVLEKPGENTQSARRIPFKNVPEITKLKATLTRYVN